MVSNGQQFKNFKLDDDTRRRWEAAKKLKPKNLFPNAGHLGEQLSDQVHAAQAAAKVDELPLMSQGEMLSVLLVCHQMLSESMQQLTETMAAVVELQKEQGSES